MEHETKGQDAGFLITAFSNNFSTFKHWADYNGLGKQDHHKQDRLKKGNANLVERFADNFITFRQWENYTHPHSPKNN